MSLSWAKAVASRPEAASQPSKVPGAIVTAAARIVRVRMASSLSLVPADGVAVAVLAEAVNHVGRVRTV